jgi:copper oxidase (laccase) domain-containing protein
MFESLHEATTFGPVKVALFGRMRRMIEDDGMAAANLAVGLGASPSKICRIIVASDENAPGFQQIKGPDYQEFVYAEGSILRSSHEAIVLQSGDCPIVLLRKDDRVIAFHAGRPALTPFCKVKSASCDYTVVENALSFLCGKTPRENVEALVLGNICGQCFKHESDEAVEKASWFLPLGEQVFGDTETLSLDLFEVIKLRLRHEGVLDENIHHLGPCTFETAGLTSYRRGDRDTRNTIVVVKI